MNLEETGFAFFQLFKLLMKLFIFSHLMACLWHAVSYYSPYSSTILKFTNYYNAPWYSRYFKCLFSTANPGRIDAQNDLELFFGFFALLATSGSMGFLITGIHNIMRVWFRSTEIKRYNSEFRFFDNIAFIYLI